VYNTPLHVGALLIVLFVSGTACAFPLLAVKFPALRIPGRFFFAVRHFGTGVLIATAFVHLLPTAFLSLGDPCLSGFWVKDYPAMPGAIVLAGIFLVTVVEMVFHPSRHISPVQVVSEYPDNNQRPANRAGTENVARVRNLGPLFGRTSSIGHQLSHLTQQTADQDSALRRKSDSDLGNRPFCDRERWTDGPQEVELTPEQKQRKELMQCVLLEVGILFHSVFIGMSLSVSVGNEFIVLLIAITFHRKYLKTLFPPITSMDVPLTRSPCRRNF
jgi:zinc transporter ZupT